MNSSEDIFFTILLSQVPGIGSVTGRILLDSLPSAKAVFEASEEELILKAQATPLAITRISETRTDKSLINKAEKELRFIEKFDIDVFIYRLPGYPFRLAAKADAPFILFAKGCANLDQTRMLSVVGSRKATEYGRRICDQLMEALSELDVLIVSGLAYGIDVWAHQAAIKYGLPTVGVLAHGLTSLYPQSNRSTAEKMLKNGSLLTEFLSDDKTRPENFPQRNRVIAGLCDACVVVEARDSGGALITAEIAHGYDTPVMAFPGRITDLLSSGCLQLIYDHKAELVCSPQQIMEQLNWDRLAVPQQMELRFTNGDEELIYNYIVNRVRPSLDDLLRQFGHLTHIPQTLMNLELSGKIRSLPGKRFEHAG